MPLEKRAKPGSPGFGRNIARERAAGKPVKQAIAIAYSEARKDCAISKHLEAVVRGDSDGKLKRDQ